MSGLMKPQPEGMEGNPFHVKPVASEWVEVDVSAPAQIHELNAELEGSLGAPDIFVFVEAEHAIERCHLRDRRLADTDDPDLVGFDERHRRIIGAEEPAERGCRHPSGGPSANDCNAA